MIQSGLLHYNVNTRGWTLASGTGERWIEPPDVKFEVPFPAPPTVMLALSGVDAYEATNLRLNIEVFDVEDEEFTVRISTWDDTIIFGVWVTWIAYD